MEIKTLRLGLIGTNCYLVSGENGAVVIDPGFKSAEAEAFLEKNNDKERLIVLTHAHFDHIGWAPVLREKTGVKIAIGTDDASALLNPDINLSNRFHANIPPFKADVLLEDNQLLTVGELSFKVYKTPGHTVGGISLLFGENLFSGDTLFKNSIGRTDFWGGEYNCLIKSVKKLLELDDSITVLSGHGEATTIGNERKYNPFINF